MINGKAGNKTNIFSSTDNYNLIFPNANLYNINRRYDNNMLSYKYLSKKITKIMIKSFKSLKEQGKQLQLPATRTTANTVPMNYVSERKSKWECLWDKKECIKNLCYLPDNCKKEIFVVSRKSREHFYFRVEGTFDQRPMGIIFIYIFIYYIAHKRLHMEWTSQKRQGVRGQLIRLSTVCNWYLIS